MNTTELLDRLEQDILIIAGEIRLQQVMRGDLTGMLIQQEERLGKMLKNVHMLKQEFGIPSSLPLVEEDEKGK